MLCSLVFQDSFPLDAIVELQCSSNGDRLNVEMNSHMLAAVSPMFASALAASRLSKQKLQWNLKFEQINENDFYSANKLNVEKASLTAGPPTIYFKTNISFELSYSLVKKYRLCISGLESNIAKGLMSALRNRNWMLPLKIPNFLLLLAFIRYNLPVRIKSIVHAYLANITINKECEIDVLDFLANQVDCDKVKELYLLVQILLFSKTEDIALDVLEECELCELHFYKLPIGYPVGLRFNNLNIMDILEVLREGGGSIHDASLHLHCRKSLSYEQLLHLLLQGSKVVTVNTGSRQIIYEYDWNPLQIYFTVEVTKPMLNVIENAGVLGLHIGSLDKLLGCPIKDTKEELSVLLSSFCIKERQATCIIHNNCVTNPSASSKRKSALAAEDKCLKRQGHEEAKLTSSISKTVKDESHSKRKSVRVIEVQNSIICPTHRKGSLHNKRRSKSLKRVHTENEDLNNCRSKRNWKWVMSAKAAYNFYSQKPKECSEKCKTIFKDNERVPLKSVKEHFSTELHSSNHIESNNRETNSNCVISTMEHDNKSNYTISEEKFSKATADDDAYSGIKTCEKKIIEQSISVQCNVTGSFENSKENLAINYETARLNSKGCPRCRLRFESALEMLIHVQNQHLADDFSQKGSPCVDSRCPVIIRVVNADSHVLSHVLQLNYNCEYCTFSCENLEGVSQHHLLHEVCSTKKKNEQYFELILPYVRGFYTRCLFCICS